MGRLSFDCPGCDLYQLKYCDFGDHVKRKHRRTPSNTDSGVSPEEQRIVDVDYTELTLTNLMAEVFSVQEMNLIVYN